MTDHTEQFETIDRLYNELEGTIEHTKKFNEMDDEVLDEVVFMTESVLETLGNMSTDVKQSIDKKEKHYIVHYKHSPALGKELWLKEYFDAFKPYDKLKERGWEIIDKANRQKQRLSKLKNY